jgi:hypothetical protein
VLFTLLPWNSLNSGSVRIIGKIGQSAQAVKVQNFIYFRFVFSLTPEGIRLTATSWKQKCAGVSMIR